MTEYVTFFLIFFLFDTVSDRRKVFVFLIYIQSPSTVLLVVVWSRTICVTAKFVSVSVSGVSVVIE